MEQYGQTVNELYAALGSGETGLTSEEALRRLASDGKNELKEGKKRSKLALFFSQFKDLMTLILIAAACLSGALAFATGDRSELADTAILLVIIFLNALVGFLQQYRADTAIENLKKLSVCTAKAVRDGTIRTVNAEELAAGDVIELEEGDRVPADCRIISSRDFRCDESALTGESKPVKKYDCIVTKPSLSERKNTAFLGTFCMKGSARCLVVATGMRTEMGKIADLLKEGKPTPSPLDRTVSKLGKVITAAVFAVAAVLFLGGLLAHRVSFLQSVMNAVAVAVAAIPEGMGAVVTVILAMGVRRMAKSRAVVRKLASVEALGSCSVICSDKTGTLTQNKMTVEEVITDFGSPASEPARGEILACMRACNTVSGKRGRYLGDPTEVALLEYADRCGYFETFRREGGTPFSSERKRMSVLVRTGGDLRLYVKGGADVVLRLCTRYLAADGVRALSDEVRDNIRARTENCSRRALRVLAFAYGEGKEENLVFLGIAAMADPPKEGAREAIAACARAGVKTVMITGDSRETALAVAARLGIASREEEVITGDEIDAMGSEYCERVQDFRVYARVSPRHKSEIVHALRAKGEVVAMTGDGVNDAPALRAADIGVAMGSGTDVTKNAADMVIADDDFSTMVRAVEEGRNVFFNIKKTISFFLSTNLAEVLCVLAASLLLWRYDFLTSTQLLWVNLITDSLPVLALGVERTENAMARPPVSDREIFSRESLLRILFFGCVQTAIVLGLFLYGLRRWGNAEASTAAFLSLSFVELFHGFNVRAEDGARAGLFSNRALLLTVLAGTALNLALALIPPLRAFFGLAALSAGQLAAVGLISLLILPVGALFRLAVRAGVRRRRTRIPLRGRSG